MLRSSGMSMYWVVVGVAGFRDYVLEVVSTLDGLIFTKRPTSSSLSRFGAEDVPGGRYIPGQNLYRSRSDDSWITTSNRLMPTATTRLSFAGRGITFLMG